MHYIGFPAGYRDRFTLRLMFSSVPSEFESYGKANLEAMACGVPVVSSRRGGPSETSSVMASPDFLVDSGDAYALAEQVLAPACAMGSYEQRMGIAGSEAHR